MAVTYEVGALFSIKDEATPVLARIAEQFTAIDEQITGLAERLATLGRAEGMFTGLQAGITNLGAAIEGIGRMADTAATAMATAFERGATAAQAAADRMNAALAGIGGGAGGGGTARGGAGRGAGGLPGMAAFGSGASANAIGDDLNRDAQQRRGPYWGDADEWANAHWEDRNRDQVYRNQRMLAEQENADLTAARAERDRRAAVVGGAAGGVVHGMWPIIGGLGAIGAEKAAMEEDRALAQGLQEMGFKAEDPRFAGLMEQLRGQVVTGTQGTIYSEAKGAKALPGTAGQFGAVFATPEERLKNYESFLPSALRFAEVGEQYGRGDLKSNLEAAIAYAHMTHRYGGAAGTREQTDMTQGLDELLYLSLATKESVTGEQSILKYSVPLGMAAGLGADETAAMTAFFQVLGFSGTTSATGLGQMLMGLTQTGGPVAAQLNAHKHDMESALVESLRLGPEEMHAIHQNRGNEHIKAMQELGLFNAQGEVAADIAPGGKLAREPFLRHIEEAMQKHTPMENLSMLRNAFTVRGSRAVAMLDDPGVVQKLNVFIENALHPRSVEDLQRESQMRPLSQFEQMLANVANIGNTLATGTLGPLNSALETMNKYLIGFNDWLKQHQTVAAVAGDVGLGVAAAGAVGLAGSAGRWLWKSTGMRALYRGTRGLISAGEAGAGLLGESLLGEGAAAGGWTVAGAALPLAGLAGLGAAILGAGALAGKMNAPMVDDYGRIIGNWGSGSPTTFPYQMKPGPRPENLPGAQSQPPAQPNKIDIHINNTMSGLFDMSTINAFVKKITDEITNALSHSQGPAQGTTTSPYTSFGFG